MRVAISETVPMERNGGLSKKRLSSVRAELTAAEQASGATRSIALSALAGALAGDAAGSRDGARVQMLVSAVRELGM